MRSLRVVPVDGFEVRNKIWTDFSGIASRDENPLLPEGQLWLENVLTDDASLVGAYLLRRELVNEGMSRQDARKAIRSSAFYRGGIEWFKGMEEVTRLSGVRVFLVDGSVLRSQFDPFFLLGGHDLVYDYVFPESVWIDRKVDRRDWKYTILHEVEERRLMAKGMSYLEAHEFAIAAERVQRARDGFLEL